MDRKIMVASISFAVVGLVSSTCAAVQGHRAARERAMLRTTIRDSISVYRDSLGDSLSLLRERAIRLLRYNSQVSQAIGGIHGVAQLRRDSVVLPSPPVKLPLPPWATDLAEALLGRVVTFNWQTNQGDYVALKIPNGRVRTRNDPGATAHAVIFHIPVIGEQSVGDLDQLDFSQLTQRDLQRLVTQHVREAEVICAGPRRDAPMPRDQVC